MIVLFQPKPIAQGHAVQGITAQRARVAQNQSLALLESLWQNLVAQALKIVRYVRKVPFAPRVQAMQNHVNRVFSATSLGSLIPSALAPALQAHIVSKDQKNI